jgi:diketogulonate reductase-like aldo/keto reductase
VIAPSEAVDRPHPPGTTKLHRLEENIAAADIELSPVDLREIDDAQLTAHGGRYGEAASQRMVDR